MKLATVLPFISLAFAYDTIRPGTLYISNLLGRPTYQDLTIRNDILLAGVDLATFEFKEGSLKLSGTERYLSVANDGKLLMDDTPYTGFSLITETGTKRTLNVGGSNEFEICWDNSIGYNSNCYNAHKITITYEDIIQPR